MQIFEAIIRDRGSKYAVSGGACRSETGVQSFIQTLKRRKKFARATHHS